MKRGSSECVGRRKRGVWFAKRGRIVLYVLWDAPKVGRCLFGAQCRIGSVLVSDPWEAFLYFLFFLFLGLWTFFFFFVLCGAVRQSNVGRQSSQLRGGKGVMITVRMVMMMMISTIAGDGRWMDGRMDGWIDRWMGRGKGFNVDVGAVSFWSVGWTEVTAVRAAGKQQEGKVMVGRLGG